MFYFFSFSIPIRKSMWINIFLCLYSIYAFYRVNHTHNVFNSFISFLFLSFFLVYGAFVSVFLVSLLYSIFFSSWNCCSSSSVWICLYFITQFLNIASTTRFLKMLTFLMKRYFIFVTIICMDMCVFCSLFAAYQHRRHIKLYLYSRILRCTWIICYVDNIMFKLPFISFHFYFYTLITSFIFVSFLLRCFFTLFC